MITRAWKVHGKEGHRQRAAFGESFSGDYTAYRDVETRYELLCSDVTGTNDYAVVKVTTPTAEACERELEGQLSDGTFENCNYGKVEEIYPKTLFDLTGNENGIIVLNNGSIIVCEWLDSECGKLPIFVPAQTLLHWPSEDPYWFNYAKARVVEDIRNEVPGTIWWLGDRDDPEADFEMDIDIAYCEGTRQENALADIFLDDTYGDRGGTVYDLPGGTKIIAPNQWH